MSSFELGEPIIKALVEIMGEHLPAKIKEINEAVTDGITLPEPAQVLDYMPIPATAAGGLPIVAIQDLPANFSNDLVHSEEATHAFGIAAILQTADHRSLAWQLRRYQQAIFRVIQDDRMALVTESKLRRPPANVMYTKFDATEPGPLLGERNPDSPAEPPSSFRSWTWVIVSCRRQEVGG
jgi:hypothetical protein